MNVQPTPGNILVDPISAEESTSSGILLPSAGKDKPQTGIVLGVGDSKAPCVKGDKVVYKKWDGSDYKDGSKDLLFIKYDGVLAIIK